jgi:O-antigen/teichoic acid export membrane protein
MTETNNYRYLRKVLASGATVFGLSALFLLLAPALFNELLGFTTNSELEWSMRMIAITLAALCGNMLSVSLRGRDSAVLLSARVMVLSASALGALTLLTPVASLTWFDYVYAAIGFGFSLAYIVGLVRTPTSNPQTPSR